MTNDICNAMRNASNLSHDDVCCVLACLAAMVQNPSALSQGCTTGLVDALDEIVGQVENDKVQQEKETAWSGQADSWMHRQDQVKAMELSMEMPS